MCAPLPCNRSMVQVSSDDEDGSAEEASEHSSGSETSGYKGSDDEERPAGMTSRHEAGKKGRTDDRKSVTSSEAGEASPEPADKEASREEKHKKKQAEADVEDAGAAVGGKSAPSKSPATKVKKARLSHSNTASPRISAVHTAAVDALEDDDTVHVGRRKAVADWSDDD